MQSLEQSSLDVWSSGTSGVGRNRDKTVNYYAKGPIVGFLLDARIQLATAGKKSLDDVMRQAYKLYGGDRGFTEDQFRFTAQEIAGIDLKEWFRKTSRQRKSSITPTHSTGSACVSPPTRSASGGKATSRGKSGSWRSAKILPIHRRPT